MEALENIYLQVAGRTEESVVDGPGLRYVLFLQGCLRGCLGCQNPSTHDPNGGVRVCIEDILKHITSNPLIHRVTFSGGEPFLQAEGLLLLARALKKRDFHLMAYSGYTFEELVGSSRFLPLLSELDILVDGAFILSQKTLDLPFRGSSNQRVIDVQASLQAGSAVLHPAHYGA